MISMYFMVVLLVRSFITRAVSRPSH